MVYDKLVKNIMIDETNPLPDISKAFSDLDSGKVDSSLLTIFQVGRDPNNYVIMAQVDTIAGAVNAKEGDLINFIILTRKRLATVGH
jgi:phosphopantothenoylcysteine synthetase/decarboxylase